MEDIEESNNNNKKPGPKNYEGVYKSFKVEHTIVFYPTSKLGSCYHSIFREPLVIEG